MIKNGGNFIGNFRNSGIGEVDALRARQSAFLAHCSAGLKRQGLARRRTNPSGVLAANGQRRSTPPKIDGFLLGDPFHIHSRIFLVRIKVNPIARKSDFSVQLRSICEAGNCFD